MGQLRLAFVGKKATGKTFVAFYLLKQHQFERVKLADGIDRMIRFMYGYAKHKRPPWERRLNMYDALYKVDPNIHVNHALDRVKTMTRHVVVEDVRYLNEVHALVKMGFKIIRVTMPETDRKQRISGLLDAASDTVILNEYFNSDLTRTYQADYTIINTTRDATRRSVDDLIAKLLTEG